MPGYEVIGDEEKQEVLSVFDTGVLFRYEFGEQRRGVYKVRRFEEEFAKYTGAAHALAVSSGSAALKVALLALGVGPGDEVLVPGFTFVATWEAVLDAGAAPVFAEIDETLCLDPADVKKKITPRTKAVIAVHMCGAMAHIPEIIEAAGEVPVLEDTAQSCGGTYQGRFLGTFGALSTFSFDAVKTLTTGEGGMVVTNDPALWTRASEYHDHGHDHRPVGRGNEGRNFFGFNYRMMELQGALGLAQLRKLPLMLEKMRANKKKLKDHLAGIEGLTFREIPDPAGDTATFLAFNLPDGEKAQAFNAVLAENKAGAVHWFRNTWHYYGAWEHLSEKKTAVASGWPFRYLDGHRLDFPREALPRTADILSGVLMWPININMTEADFTRLCSAADRAAAVL
ncbi:MAG: DegT/DnrJ/EryC1/StrS family aminotransferase [Thermodesulfobacteriota bacterium]